MHSQLDFNYLKKKKRSECINEVIKNNISDAQVKSNSLPFPLKGLDLQSSPSDGAS